MQLSAATNDPVIPDHIPEQVVSDFPLVMGAFTKENPFDTLVREACEGPDAIYSPNALPVGTGGAWVFRRQKDLREIYNDAEHFSNKGFTPYAKILEEDWSLVPAEQDLPEHTFYRQLLNPLFSPKAIADMEDSLRTAAKKWIATFSDSNGCDFIDKFANRFPITVVLDLMGLPEAKLEEFLVWENQLLQAKTMEEMQEGTRNVCTYLREVIAERKANPGDDLISFAIKADVNGRKMTDNELLGYAFNFYIGGLDTVTANLGNFMRHLATNIEHQNELRQNPKKIRIAIEEFLRAFSAVTTVRVCIKEKQIAGVTLKPGDKVWMCTTVPNRDADVYENPHEVILDRNPAHVTFATGPHHCLGVHLARLELRVALEELLKALPEFTLEPGCEINSAAGPVIQPQSLPLVW
jgi:cytochrome P450